jgi:hypothetical protein
MKKISQNRLISVSTRPTVNARWGTNDRDSVPETVSSTRSA